MYLYEIVRNIKRNKARNVCVTAIITIGLVIIMLTLAKYRYRINKMEVYKNTVENNVYSPIVRGKLKISAGVVGGTTKNITIAESPNKIIELIKNDSRVKAIASMNCYTFDEQSTTIKCPINTFNLIEHNKEISSIFNFRLEKGVSFSEYHSKCSNAEVKPMLISKALEKMNPIGSIVEIKAGIYRNGASCKYKIIGVLDPQYPTIEEIKNYEMVDPYREYTVIVDDNDSSMSGVIFIKLNDTTTDLEFKKSIDMKLDKDEEVSLNNLKSGLDYMLLSVGFVSKYIFYGVIILALTSLGVLAIFLTEVVKRKKEFGVRFTLGATNKHIEKLILGEMLVLFVTGGVLSLIFMFLISKISSGLLFDFYVLKIDLLILFVLMIGLSLPILYKILRINPLEVISGRR
ncbi:ABC transporter permease [Inconstantimicrobium mannanitabidum]|uniref:Uncharacterized protein n=1 Tax=Inconstantimicrobium mannanitabidum TaxID=1604901 RepID=A0ACB5RGS4_9CLOT|nr:ABC transporter permease [Clostridium sp. TW13]GKX68282.1 hypothetical protein rsdtw13_35400 [Clostridium sp. TW13]